MKQSSQQTYRQHRGIFRTHPRFPRDPQVVAELDVEVEVGASEGCPENCCEPPSHAKALQDVCLNSLCGCCGQSQQRHSREALPVHTQVQDPLQWW